MPRKLILPYLCLLYFINYLGRVNIGFASPNGMSEELKHIVERGLINAIPYVLGAVAMVLWARHGDRTGERK